MIVSPSPRWVPVLAARRVLDAAGRMATTASSCASSRATTRSGPGRSSRPGPAETLARLADAGLAVPCVDTRSFFPLAPTPRPVASVEERSERPTWRPGSGPRRPGLRRPRAARRGPRLDAGLDRESLASCGASSAAAGSRCARDARRLRPRRRDPLAPAERRGAGARRGVDPANPSRSSGERSRRRGSRSLPAPRPPEDERHPPGGKVPWPPALPGRGRLPGRRVLAWLQGRGDRGCPSMGEALAPGDRGAGSGAPPLPPVGGRRAAGPAGDGALRARASSPAAACASRCTRAGRRWRRGRPCGRGAIRALLARDGKAPSLRLGALAERVPRRAAAGARHRLAEAHRFHLDEYVASHPTIPPPSVVLSIASSPREGRRLPRPRRRGRDLAAECARYAALLRQARPALAILGVGRTATSLHRPAGLRTSRRGGRESGRARRALPAAAVNDGCFPSLERCLGTGALAHRPLP